MTKCIHSLTHFLKLLHLLYDPGGPKLPLSTICNFLHKNAPNQIYDETHAKAVYAFQIFPAQKPAVNLRLLANTLLSLVGGEGEASFGCEVSHSHLTLLKTAYFLWLLIYPELTLSKPGLDSYLTGLDHIDRHRLTAPDLEDSIQALLGQNEEEAVQMFLKHAGKFLFQQDR